MERMPLHDLPLLKNVPLLPGSSQQKVKKIPKSYVFELDLGEPNDKTNPEFSWADLVRDARAKEAAENKKKGGTTLDPFASDDEDELKAMAARFEEKYGNQSPKVPPKKKRKKRIDDCTDRAAGYDESDSFIDNTDAYDERVPLELQPAYGGFYINSGQLDFKEVEISDDDDDDDESEEDLKAKPTVKVKPRVERTQKLEEPSKKKRKLSNDTPVGKPKQVVTEKGKQNNLAGVVLSSTNNTDGVKKRPRQISSSSGSDSSSNSSSSSSDSDGSSSSSENDEVGKTKGKKKQHTAEVIVLKSSITPAKSELVEKQKSEIGRAATIKPTTVFPRKPRVKNVPLNPNLHRQPSVIVANTNSPQIGKKPPSVSATLPLPKSLLQPTPTGGNSVVEITKVKKQLSSLSSAITVTQVKDANIHSIPPMQNFLFANNVKVSSLPQATLSTTSTISKISNYPQASLYSTSSTASKISNYQPIMTSTTHNTAKVPNHPKSNSSPGAPPNSAKASNHSHLTKSPGTHPSSTKVSTHSQPALSTGANFTKVSSHSPQSNIIPGPPPIFAKPSNQSPSNLSSGASSNSAKVSNSSKSNLLPHSARASNHSQPNLSPGTPSVFSKPSNQSQSNVSSGTSPNSAKASNHSNSNMSSGHFPNSAKSSNHSQLTKSSNTHHSSAKVSPHSQSPLSANAGAKFAKVSSPSPQSNISSGTTPISAKVSSHSPQSNISSAPPTIFAKPSTHSQTSTLSGVPTNSAKLSGISPQSNISSSFTPKGKYILNMPNNSKLPGHITSYDVNALLCSTNTLPNIPNTTKSSASQQTKK